MASSYEKVNYLLRLRKQIERRMMIEARQRLAPLIDIEQYRYFGFGSVYFADFILFHKYLNIKLMTSIDNKREDEQRFMFNKPFEFVNFKIADSQAFLETELDWQEKLFIWLDYDNPLDAGMLDDIELIAARAKPLDFIFMTVEAELPVEPLDFIGMFEAYLPAGRLTGKAIKEDFPGALRDIMRGSIEKGLNSQIKVMHFLQMFNFFYKDTKAMYTFGGMFYQGSLDAEVTERLKNLFYISREDSVVFINPPLLTPKEKLHLDSCVKADNVCEDRESGTGLSHEEVKKYGLFYKYYPQFFESIY